MDRFECILLELMTRQHHELLRMMKAMSDAQTQAIADLTAQVQQSVTIDEGAITLLTGLKTALDAAIASSATDDSAALNDLSASLGTETNALAAAITANTPTSTAPAPSDGAPADQAPAAAPDAAPADDGSDAA